MRKTQIFMNRLVYSFLSILDLDKTVKYMHEFCCEYVKPKYDENANLVYVDTDTFIVHVKT